METVRRHHCECAGPQKSPLREYVDAVAEKLPVLWAIHDRCDGNPHVHMQFCPRIEDGIERKDGAAWFKRANPKSPALGGAASISDSTGKEWITLVRSTWAELANKALKNAGHQAQIDHRSYEAQGVESMPTEHVGWSAGERREGAIKRNAQAQVINARMEELLRERARAAAAQKIEEAAERAGAAATSLDRKEREDEALRRAESDKACCKPS